MGDWRGWQALPCTSAGDLGILGHHFLITCVDVFEVPKPPAVIVIVALDTFSI